MTIRPKRLLAVLSGAFFAAALIISATFGWFRYRAAFRDFDVSEVAAGPCLHPLANVSVPRVMSEHESRLLVMQLVSGNGRKCTAIVELAAAGFEISPPENIRKVDLGGQNQAATITWSVAPRQAGSYAIHIRAGMDEQNIGIEVTNILGLSAKTALILDYVCWSLGALLSVQWWIDKISAWRSARRPSSVDSPTG